MALLFMEGFGHHGTANADMSTALTAKWSTRTGTLANTTGRVINRSAELGTGDVITSPIFSSPPQTIIVGFSVLLTTTRGTGLFLKLQDGDNTNQVHIRLDGGNVMFVTNAAGSVVYGRVSINFRNDKWYYVECKVTIDNTVGTVEIRVNNTTEINESGLDTQNTGNSQVDRIEFVGSSSNTIRIDDIYVADTTGSLNNDFLGDVGVEALFADSAGSNTEWAVTGAASNFQAVNENPSDTTTSFVSDDTAEQTDTYNFDDLSFVSQNVKGIQTNTSAKSGSTSRQINEVTISGATTDEDLLDNLDTGFEYRLNVRETDPDTGVAWTVSGVNSAEFGVSLKG